MRPFHQILANNLVANVTNFTIWFALTFWVFLETRSVFATGMIAGIYLVMTAALGFWFGSLVDRHRKRTVMMLSSAASLLFYVASIAVVLVTPDETFRSVSSVELWLFILLVMAGVIAGNIRSIALPALVTALVPEDRRDRANGLVGMVTGIGFVMTSAVSGFLVAWGGMAAALGFGLALTLVALAHLAWLKLDEPAPDTKTEGHSKVDIRGTIRLVAGIPGLFALIFFAAFNNLLGGVFMSLMDAYGLSLMEVEQWGLLWAVVSCGFILSGILIARVGLGTNPLRSLLLVNVVIWTASSLFTVQPSILLLAAGCFVWLFFSPFIEAAEHTTMQAVVPFERQGRVFGFAQSVEQAVSPLTAFLMGPLTQFVFIPFMTDGAGARAIGGWYGTGPDRGIALVFTIAGLLGLAGTLLALKSRAYRDLSATYARNKDAAVRSA